MFITENIIAKSIIYQLKKYFGDSYEYHTEELPQKFKRPCFAILKATDSSRKGYTGHNYSMTSNTYRYIIQYFTDNELLPNKDLNDITDGIKEVFRYLDIIQLNEDGSLIKNEDGSLSTFTNRVNSIDVDKSDGVLIVGIQFSLRTVIVEDIDKVLYNYLDEYIKNI